MNNLILLLVLTLSIFTYALGQPKTNTQEMHIFGGENIKGGSSLEQKAALEGLSHLRNVVKASNKEFADCLEKAYLVEHRNKRGIEIARMFLSEKIVTITIKELGTKGDFIIHGQAKLDIDEETLRLDDDFVRENAGNIRVIAGVIGHELAHNFGFKHSRHDFGDDYYQNTVPEQVEACICKGRPNPKPRKKGVNDIIAISLDGDNNYVFSYYQDGTVGAGTTDKLNYRRTPKKFKLPTGKRTWDIVGIVLDGSNNHHFAFYKDGTVSAGSSVDLTKYREPYRYSLPKGKQPTDIVGMGIDGDNNHIYVWYRDGTVSAGSSSDLDKYRRPYRYALPKGKKPTDIVGIAIDGDNNHNYVWFKDGTVSAGSSNVLDKYRKPYRYTIK